MALLRRCFAVLLLLAGLVPAARAQAPLYFPPRSFAQPWDTIAPAQLGWNQVALDSALAYVERTNARSFIVLHRGRIAVERYFDGHTRDSVWMWASASKTLTAFLVGIAQQEGLLSIDDTTSRFLGTGWTSLPPAQERLITIRHQLTMTTGLNDTLAPTPQVPDPDNCLAPACLQYLAPAGTRWAYHNAPYKLVQNVVAAASGQSWQQFTQTRVKTAIGMGGGWFDTYISRTRDMARFGLLLLARGTWNGTPLLTDTAYFGQMTRPSQTFNRAYGYLTWLNGQSSYMHPAGQLVFPGPLAPDAPADLYAALGKDDQKIYVVPSLGLVVVRQGEAAAGRLLGPSSFDNELWIRLMRVLGPTGTADAATANSVALYPNPATATVRLSGLTAPALAFYDATGRLARTASRTADGTYDVRGLAPGLYAMRAGGRGVGRLVVE